MTPTGRHGGSRVRLSRRRSEAACGRKGQRQCASAVPGVSRPGRVGGVQRWSPRVASGRGEGLERSVEVLSAGVLRADDSVQPRAYFTGVQIADADEDLFDV